MNKKNKNMKLGLAALAIILLIGVMVASNKTQAPTTQNNVVTTMPESTTAPTDVLTNTSSYKNGSFSAEGSYVSPAGPEQVDVSLTLTDGRITDVNFEGKAVNPNSKRFQGIFSENYKQFVVGKNIDEVKLDKVAGSSLAPKGFNDAIEKIKEQAKA
ncbi:MAG TPA: hypothetical protein VK338_02385 [Candidatus Nitrosocosmicus sp.]|nr:hypothetical protein [Candidatus Nitrosocosmicus sp.]